VPAVALLLGKLPPYSNRRVVIERRQSVYDIIREVLTAHRLFASHYDTIAAEFWRGDLSRTSAYLWQFCKNNIRYHVETEESQTTKSPAAMLSHAVGDCKHYAGFVGGVLDALRRQGKRINWVYRFAGYNGGREPEHVFIVVKDGLRELWIDPVLESFNQRKRPTNYIDKKISMLSRLSGVDSVKLDYPVSDVLSSVDYGLSPDLYNAIQLLLKHGVMNAEAKVNTSVIDRYKDLPALQIELRNAVALINQASIGGLFSTIWRGVKKVTLLPMRAAYLSLVAINAFGFATKLKNAIYNPDGSISQFKDRIKTIWQDRFAGDWAILSQAINRGATKPAILGAVAAAPAAWAVTAAAIIAALTPIITAALKARQTQTPEVNYSIDPTTGMPYGSPNVGSGSALDWIRENPAIVAAGLVGIYFLTRKKRTA
jgi:hypothetical protein